MRLGPGRKDRCLVFCCVAFALLMGNVFLPSSAFCEQTYRFERSWPALQQPWYFYYPLGIAVDKDDNVYVAEHASSSIKKLTSDGRLVTRWGEPGSAKGKIGCIWDMATDDFGNVYVTDACWDRIQKFDANGTFLLEWGRYGSGEGEFNGASGVTVDHAGNVYAADAGNHRIQKFTSEGRFITMWGKYGDGPGEFNLRSSIKDQTPWLPGLGTDSSGNVYVADIGNARIQKFDSNGKFVMTFGAWGYFKGTFIDPTDVAVDGSGSIYVVDSGNHRIQKFGPDGQYVGKWGRPSFEDGGFDFAWGIAVDKKGNVYVSDLYTGRIQKFTSDGAFLTLWSSQSSQEKHFFYPFGVAVARDGSGDVYVADDVNSRIQRFSAEGRFIQTWGAYGSGNGQFDNPRGLAAGRDGVIYVVDASNARVQKFTSDGKFIAKWGSYGTGKGQFIHPHGAATDESGNVYIADTGNCRVQKFTGDGRFIGSWGMRGAGSGEFTYPHSIAVDSRGSVYVSDEEQSRVKKFTAEGKFILEWGFDGPFNGEFREPQGIAVDGRGNVYVADSVNNRVQVFTEQGEYLTGWGKQGYGPGQMREPNGLAVDANGNIYVTEWVNARIQVFRDVDVVPNNRAIIVAGGGPYAGNHLWEATQMCANFAYRTLTLQGFTKEKITYLSSDTDIDLDGNGKADDVDGKATVANLRQAVTVWAKGAENVVLYLTDHGGEGIFRMSGGESLSAEVLSSWLDALQKTLRGKLIVVYDACRSGSFLNTLSSSAGKGRIILCSTSPGEDAYFVNSGSISFSNYFWTNIFNGMDIFHAFSLARDAIGYTSEYQHPLLDDNGNGVGYPQDRRDGDLARSTFIGNGTESFNGAPVIREVSPDQTISGTSVASFYAEGVRDPDGIARVWAMIRPPNFASSPDGSPVKEIPSVELTRCEGKRYEGKWDRFNASGTYQVAVYAEDRIGNTSIPRLTTVTVDSPLTRKAILVAGGSPSGDLPREMEKSIRSAYEALTFQGYAEDQITFMSPVVLPGVDQMPTLDNLEHAIRAWAAESTHDLVLYLIGSAEEGTFRINSSQTLSAEELDEWLDELQEHLPGKVTFIYDACLSGSFLPSLTPPRGKDRILIASTASDEPACFVSSGDISFSRFFWNEVANGATVWESFLQAKNAIRYACLQQTPRLDDNGNGAGNEKADGQVARNYTLGTGIVLAGDAPMIGKICPAQTLTGETTARIWVEAVTSTGTVEKVWAVITPPEPHSGSPADPVTDLPAVALRSAGKGRYEGVYRRFSAPGIYTIAVYAMDSDGKISLPQKTTVQQSE